MILSETVLQRLHGSWAGERGADEAEADGLELAGRQHGGGIAGPETVKVARQDRESGDLRIADKVVDLPALVVRTAPVVSAHHGECVGRPLLLRQAIGQILRIDPIVESSLRIAPDLPGGRGPAELIEKPLLLIGAEDRARR